MQQEEFLSKSLLYQMSLGSKELYHSNVWAWLIENDTSFIKVFFPRFNENEYSVLGVSRECRHRDLIVWLHKNGYPDNEQKYYLIIENKIKSLHEYKQLEGYTEYLWDNQLLLAAFTGIENNLDQDDLYITNENTGALWQFRSYCDISDGIRRIATASTSEVICQRLQQIYEYCDIVSSIDFLLKSAKKSSCGKLSYETHGIALSDERIRLKDVFIKLKGADFISYIKMHRAELEALCPSGKGFVLLIEQSFHNLKATLDIRFTNRRADTEHYFLIGVQIEGMQYRLCAEMDGKAHSVDNVYESLKDVWFDDTFDYRTNRRVFGRPTSMRGKYDSYGKGSNAYSFVYQYYNLDESNNKYQDLLEDIKRDMTKASEIIKASEFL